MVRDLADFFGIGLAGGGEIIPLEQDICHVRSYLDIQKMRYGDRLIIRSGSAEELKKLYTVKLLIQPLAENFCFSRDQGIGPERHRLFTAGEEPGGSLYVRDDGLGITPKTLRRS